MITVTHSRDENFLYDNNRHSWSFKSTAVSDNEDTDNIFVYKRVKDDEGNDLGHFFLAIASISQLTSVGTDTTDDMYRTNTVEIDSRSDDDREIEISDIDTMVDDFNKQVEAYEIMKVSDSYETE